MTLTRSVPGLLIACALVACGGPLPLEPGPLQPPATTTPEVDSGSSSPDAGAPAPPPDGGTADAGSSAPDGGQADAGSPSGQPDAGAPDAGPPPPPPPPPPPAGPHFGACQIFPADDAFNVDVSSLPADAHSADYLAQMQAGSLFLHPDFGAEPYGLPFTAVPGSQPRVPMTFTYAAQSNPGPYPFPNDLSIQATGDRHAIVVDTANCLLYETYQTWPSGAGFSADSGAVFDLTSGAPRPEGWTSATASGMPIFPGLSRPDEVLDQGAIHHALVFTSGGSAHSYVHPATHSSGTSTATYAPPMGLRVRLRADYDLSRFSGPSLVILTALRHYGMFMIDNTAPGYFWSLGGTQSPRWPDAQLQILKSVPASAFEVVQLGTLHQGP